MKDSEWVIDDKELSIMQELWELVEIARADGKNI